MYIYIYREREREKSNLENLPFQIVTYTEKVNDQNNAPEQWKITKNSETNPRIYTKI